MGFEARTLAVIKHVITTEQRGSINKHPKHKQASAMLDTLARQPSDVRKHLET